MPNERHPYSPGRSSVGRLHSWQLGRLHLYCHSPGRCLSARRVERTTCTVSCSDDIDDCISTLVKEKQAKVFLAIRKESKLIYSLLSFQTFCLFPDRSKRCQMLLRLLENSKETWIT
ncbi:unnamed protein product [Cuscuta europaea]|uniref:Uncharacterized protein n=1 Tax=Cuscuta europaea TaxID=41803 RepID=A0A9P0YH51_CUSEU|nr:unnamed protein product [Cuscuta europaea]